MKPQDITATHPVMSCPACNEEITANVTVSPTIGTPKLNGSKVDLSVTAELQTFSINHHCRGRVTALDVPA